MATDERADAVDRIVDEWRAVRPDLDVSPMAVVGRLSRLARLVDQRLAQNFAASDIESWIYDVLATLRRIGPPHELSPTELVAHTMVTTGAMTNRIDRLIERGLVERDHDPDDRRRVVVRLTADGLALVDRVAPGHYEVEHQVLAPLDRADREALAATLRSLLLHLGDEA